MSGVSAHPRSVETWVSVSWLATADHYPLTPHVPVWVRSGGSFHCVSFCLTHPVFPCFLSFPGFLMFGMFVSVANTLVLVFVPKLPPICKPRLRDSSDLIIFGTQGLVGKLKIWMFVYYVQVFTECGSHTDRSLCGSEMITRQVF